MRGDRDSLEMVYLNLAGLIGAFLHRTQQHIPEARSAPRTPPIDVRA